MAINEGTPNFPADAASRYGLGIYGPDGNFYAFRGDSNKNLLVALGAALPAGANLIGGVNASQVGGDAVPSPAALGVHALPVLGTPQALYLTQTITPTTTAAQFTLGNIAMAGNAVFDGKSALVVLVNNSNQAISGGELQFQDTIGGVSVSKLYYFTANSGLDVAASGGSISMPMVLGEGVLRNLNVGINFNVAPTTGTVSCLVVVQGPGGPPARGRMSPPQTTAVGTTAGKFIDKVASRLSITFYNPGPGTLWLGRDSTVGVNKGIPVPAGQYLTDDASNDAWYGVMDAGSASVCWTETSSQWQS